VAHQPTDQIDADHLTRAIARGDAAISVVSYKATNINTSAIDIYFFQAQI
jgi:hypothetical protein